MNQIHIRRRVRRKEHTTKNNKEDAMMTVTTNLAKHFGVGWKVQCGHPNGFREAKVGDYFVSGEATSGELVQDGRFDSYRHVGGTKPLNGRQLVQLRRCGSNDHKVIKQRGFGPSAGQCGGQGGNLRPSMRGRG